MCRGRRHPRWRAAWRTSRLGRARRPRRRPACWRPTWTRSAPCCTRARCSRSRLPTSALLALTSPWSSCSTRTTCKLYSLQRTNCRRIQTACFLSTNCESRDRCRSSMCRNGTKTHQRPERASFSASVCLTRPLRRRAGADSTRRLHRWAALEGPSNHPHPSCHHTPPASADGLLAGLILTKHPRARPHEAALGALVLCARPQRVLHSARDSPTLAGEVRSGSTAHREHHMRG